jgi:hypothetical protein
MQVARFERHLLPRCSSGSARRHSSSKPDMSVVRSAVIGHKTNDAAGKANRVSTIRPMGSRNLLDRACDAHGPVP